MMEKILGIDTGTNSIGWAIVEKNDNAYHLIDKGTNIFSEGVKIEKGIESSKAAERTEHRSVRKHYWRRRVRKIRLLTILSENNLCPPLTRDSLRVWRLKRTYPQSEAFMSWQRTEDKENINPYRFRYICLTKKLDLSDLTQRYILGRALYHLNQRRGFLSNRKETTKESDGKVAKSIDNLSKEIETAGCRYLGEYFYQLYQRGERIRNKYTARKEHYLKEFNAICDMQELDADLRAKLEKAIFYQRPLKSQKGTVGTCKFEKGKTRCSTSHPLYEEFRMYQFLNNIKIQKNDIFDSEVRGLNEEEKEKVIPLFFRKSKKTFPFEDIAKEIAGKNNYCCKDDVGEKLYKFNYSKDFLVVNAPVTARLREIFGEEWLDGACEVYTLAKNKTRFQIMNDIWHALFFYDDEEKLKEFAQTRLQLGDVDAEKFSKIPLPTDYASLSLKAIRKILPYMRDYGLTYSQAVFLANLENVLPRHIWGIRETREAAIENVIEQVQLHDKNCTDGTNLEHCIKGYLCEQYGVDEQALNKLYHPSMIDMYPHVRPNSDGIYQLGSPRISSVKNPMAMHSLFRLRKVVNLLLKEGKIDENTTIHIEFSRDLNDANRRWAIQEWQKKQRNEHEECRKEVEKYIPNPTDNDIRKYQLWKEQGTKCLYTGETIGVSDFLGDNPNYDIEHTIPRSVGGDSTMMNLTLCSSRYNRDEKKAKLPSQLAEHSKILERIAGWKEKYEKLDRQIRQINTKGLSSKEEKDKQIRRRHLLSLQRDYWKGKYKRFTMTKVPEGFSRRQGTDISVISRYARLYLKSVFKHVYIIKGIATSDFRQIWGLQEEYTKKERVNHVHHCIDAITIACIGKAEYDKLAQYYHESDEFKQGRGAKPQFEKPWPTFVSDVKQIQDELLIAHYSKDNMPKQARRYVRSTKGTKTLTQGDAARASLHNDTYYGAIEVDGLVKYVVRKSLDTIKEEDVKNIVDREVCSKVEQAILLHGSLKNAVKAGIWMNEEKQIPIKKVRLFAGSVTRPIHIRQQRDVSRHQYKRQYYVQNDRNYMMAIYVGKDKNGKEKREFELINNITAAEFYRRSNDREPVDNQMIPSTKNNCDLKYQLKIGTMVLLYENHPDEVWELDRKNLQKRLYKVTGFSSKVIKKKYDYGTITLVHHQDARPSTEIKLTSGEFKTTDEFRAGIIFLHTQFKALVQGVDFEMNDLGEIRRLI